MEASIECELKMSFSQDLFIKGKAILRDVTLVPKRATSRGPLPC